MVKNFYLAAAVTCAAFGLSSSAQAGSITAITDVTGDGKAELVLVDKTDSGYTWTTVKASGVSSTYNYGSSEGTMILGDFNGDGKSEPTALKPVNGKLVWYARRVGGRASKISTWGLTGDRPVPADFDCDGKTDQVVTRVDGEVLRWYIKYSSTDGGTRNFPLGTKTAQPFAADMNGDGCDEAVVADLSNGEYVWTWRRHNWAKKTTKTWGAEGDTLLKPSDINNDGKDDYVVARNDGGEKKFYVYLTGETGSDATITATFGLASDTAYVAPFMDRRYAQLAVYRPTTGVLYATKQNGQTLTKYGPTGAGNIIGSDGVYTETNTTETTVCTDNIVDIDDLSGVLYKPVNVHGGRGPTFIVKNRSQQTNKRRLEIRNANCEVIAAIGLFSATGPYGARYYMKSGGTGETAEELLSMALEAGSTSILIEGVNGTWIRIANPKNRDGSL